MKIVKNISIDGDLAERAAAAHRRGLSAAIDESLRQWLSPNVIHVRVDPSTRQYIDAAVAATELDGYHHLFAYHILPHLRRQFFNCHSCGLPIVPAGEWAVLKDAGKTHIDCPHCKTENPV
jgi:hypothetical protein